MRNKRVHPREQDQELLGGGSEPWSGALVSQEPGAASSDVGLLQPQSQPTGVCWSLAAGFSMRDGLCPRPEVL